MDRWSPRVPSSQYISQNFVYSASRGKFWYTVKKNLK